MIRLILCSMSAAWGIVCLNTATALPIYRKCDVLLFSGIRHRAEEKSKALIKLVCIKVGLSVCLLNSSVAWHSCQPLASNGRWSRHGSLRNRSRYMYLYVRTGLIRTSSFDCVTRLTSMPLESGGRYFCTLASVKWGWRKTRYRQLIRCDEIVY